MLLVLTSIQVGLMDIEGNLVGEPDGQSFGLGVAPFSVKPGKKPKTKKTPKDQFR
jgi:kinesin family protein 6/9